MCMENTNAICKLYDHVIGGESDYSKFTYQNQFNGIALKFNESGIPYIGGFFVVTDLNFLGTTKEDKKATNVVNSKIPVRCQIKMTRVSRNPDKQLSWILDEFTIDPNTEGMIRRVACVETMDYTRVTPVDQILLNGSDYECEYVIKVLLKSEEQVNQQSEAKENKTDNKSSLWIVQTISHLKVVRMPL